MLEYTPSFLQVLPRPMDQRTCPFPSSWAGLERLLPALLKDFDVHPGKALEFGVQHGFSTAALANYFESVEGVDTFQGDQHAGFGDPVATMRDTALRLAGFPNVTLLRSDYQSFGAAHDSASYDLVHIDIVHTFYDTYQCGRWSLRRSSCVIFHDTISFPEVQRAVAQLAEESGRNFYNFSKHYGLGILRAGR